MDIEDEDQWSKMAMDAVWPKFYDSVGGKAEVDKVVKALDAKSRSTCPATSRADGLKPVESFMRAKPVLKLLDNFESYLCQILLVFFVCLLFLQILLRLVFGVFHRLSQYIRGF